MRAHAFPAAVCLLASAGAALADAVVIRGKLHTAAGPAIEQGAVVIEGGKIVRVGPWSEVAGAVPAGAVVVDVPGAEVTPGLIDAACQGLDDEAEQSSEVVPHLRALDGLNLSSPEWSRLARRGVTTVFAVGDPASVIGPRGALLKTAGPVGRRVIEPAGAVRFTLGREAWTRGRRNRGPWGGPDLATRRPNTRMGLTWVLREALHGARAGEPGPAAEALREVLAGRTPLRVQARQRHDIETALRLQEELGIPGTLLLEEATEAWRMKELLAARKVRLAVGPLFERPRGYRASTGEAEEPCLRAPAMLAEAGVELCLTAADRRDEDGLDVQAMLAIRYGLPFERALAAVTAVPARFVGAEARLGTLEAGKDADLVLWSGKPFEATTRPILVLIDGQPALGELPRTAAAPRERF